MTFFSGEYECKLDPKGRLLLPSKVKSKLPDSEVVELALVRGFEPCLVIYPMVEWKKIFSRVAGLNEFNAEYRDFQRNFFRGSTEVELDNAGRFLLPKLMQKHAGLDKDAILVGLGNRLELWNPERYEAYLSKDADEFSKQAEKYLSGEI